MTKTRTVGGLLDHFREPGPSPGTGITHFGHAHDRSLKARAAQGGGANVSAE